MEEAIRQRIQELVSKNEVLLFMKGTKNFPQCGFSSQVVGILGELDQPFQSVNILAEPELREGMKEFSSWPTFPQLYVRGAFVGGCDIVRDMHASGELRTLLGVQEPKAPRVEVTEAAAKAFRDALEGAGTDVLRLEITAEFQYDLHVGPKLATDIESRTASGLSLFVEQASARRADGMKIDFVSAGASGGGFKMENPNEPPRVKSMTPSDLKAWLDKRARGEATFELLDVRPKPERDRASIDGAVMLTAEIDERLRHGEKGKMLIFHCHHGMRSRSAAEHFLGDGFTNVWNLEGGVDAWSLKVDPTVPRY